MILCCDPSDRAGDFADNSLFLFHRHLAGGEDSQILWSVVTLYG